MNAQKSFPIPLSVILFIGIVAISLSSIFVRWSDAPVSVIAMYRLLLTNLLMLPFLWKHWPDVRKITFKEWRLLFWSGLALGLHFLLWMASLRYTSVASSTSILTLEPVLVMLGSYWAFKQRNHPLTVIGMVIAIGGAALIGWGDFGLSSKNLFGDLLSFLGTVAVAVHMLIGKSLRARMSAFVYSFFVFSMAWIVLAVYNMGMSFSFTAYPPSEWGVFLLLAIVPTLFGHYLFNWLLKYMKASSVSMTVLGEPLGATILAYFLLGESVSWMQAEAGLLLLFGVWLFMKGMEREGNKPAPSPRPLKEIPS